MVKYRIVITYRWYAVSVLFLLIKRLIKKQRKARKINENWQRKGGKRKDKGREKREKKARSEARTMPEKTCSVTLIQGRTLFYFEACL